MTRGLRRDDREPVAYQVTRAAIDMTGNPRARFMHWLPAFHDKNTKVGGEIMGETGMDEVFESPNQRVR